jgi:hypothetical protein
LCDQFNYETKVSEKWLTHFVAADDAQALAAEPAARKRSRLANAILPIPNLQEAAGVTPIAGSNPFTEKQLLLQPVGHGGVVKGHFAGIIAFIPPDMAVGEKDVLAS